jgi:NhaP-type Na+/H+ or K+/H+ antiporter
MARHWKSLSVLLTLGMVLMWASSTAFVYLIVRPSLLIAALIGAIVTPTDPVIASSIVQGSVARKNLPGGLRDIIAAESSLNDGAAYPFVFLPILLLAHPAGRALTTWATNVWLLQVIGATAMGAVVSWPTAKSLAFAKQRGIIEHASFLAYGLAIALVTLGGVKLIGSDAILAVLMFRRFCGGDEVDKQRRVTSDVDRFFTLPIFVLLGTLLPWQDRIALRWRAPAIRG